jgi:hypothetical protein
MGLDGREGTFEPGERRREEETGVDRRREEENRMESRRDGEQRGKASRRDGEQRGGRAEGKEGVAFLDLLLVWQIIALLLSRGLCVCYPCSSSRASSVRGGLVRGLLGGNGPCKVQERMGTRFFHNLLK